MADRVLNVRGGDGSGDGSTVVMVIIVTTDATDGRTPAKPSDDQPVRAESVGPVAEGGDESARPRLPRKRLGVLLRIAFLVLAVALGIYALADQWTQVRSGFAELGVATLVVALVITLIAWFVMMLSWRGLLAASGSPLPVLAASRIFFTGQLGKYIPGSVWSVLAHMELGRANNVPRGRSAAVAVLAMLVSLGAALLTAAATLPLAASQATAGYRWAFLAVPVLLACLHPRIVNPALATLFRLTKRPRLERDLTGRAIAGAVARSLGGWLLAGTHLWLLAVRLGAPPGKTFLLAVGGFAFAWSVGFLVVLAPAGAGVREVLLIAALSPVLDPGKATTVALASRLVTVAADLVASGAAAVRRARTTASS